MISVNKKFNTGLLMSPPIFLFHDIIENKIIKLYLFNKFVNIIRFSGLNLFVNNKLSAIFNMLK